MATTTCLIKWRTMIFSRCNRFVLRRQEVLNKKIERSTDEGHPSVLSMLCHSHLDQGGWERRKSDNIPRRRWRWTAVLLGEGGASLSGDCLHSCYEGRETNTTERTWSMTRCTHTPQGILCRGYMLPIRIILELLQVRTVYKCTECDREVVGSAEKQWSNAPLVNTTWPTRDWYSNALVVGIPTATVSPTSTCSLSVCCNPSKQHPNQ